MKNLTTILCLCFFCFSCGKGELSEGELRIEKEIEKIISHRVSPWYDTDERYVDIEFIGGLLNINWKKDNNIYMTGKVSEVKKITVNI